MFSDECFLFRHSELKNLTATFQRRTAPWLLRLGLSAPLRFEFRILPLASVAVNAYIIRLLDGSRNYLRGHKVQQQQVVGCRWSLLFPFCPFDCCSKWAASAALASWNAACPAVPIVCISIYLISVYFTSGCSIARFVNNNTPEWLSVYR